MHCILFFPSLSMDGREEEGEPGRDRRRDLISAHTHTFFILPLVAARNDIVLVPLLFSVAVPGFNLIKRR